MATPAQVKTIHALKSILKMDDADYRAMLESYTNSEGAPVWSSKDLSYAQASSLIQIMEQIIDRTPGLKSRLYASRKQLGFVNMLWRRVTRAADEEGVNNTLYSFLEKRFHIRRIDRISKKKIAKVIKSLRIMSGQGRA